MIDLLTDRTRREATTVLSGTWLLFCIALCLALPQPPKLSYVALGSLAGAALIALGFAAASRWRSVPAHQLRERLRLAAVSVLAGSALGAVLLAALVALARAEPLLLAHFAGRLAEPAWRPWALGFESSVLEEITYRLFAMSVTAWLALRLFKRQNAATAIALGASCILFGLAHLPAWSSLAPVTTSLIAGVLLLNGIGGLLFGWIFWRWGLPYAILCHFAGDVVIQSFAPRLLS
jgi:hypothetical protein